MPTASHRLLRSLIAWGAVLAALAALAPVPALGTEPAGGGCATRLLDRATRASEVAGLAVPMAADRTLWLDTCGRAFHVEPADPPHAARAETVDGPTASTDPGSLSSALQLESRPGAARTIYLDFTGGTVTDTAWNRTYAAPTLTVAPYSITAPADVAFTTAELTEIQKAWQVVAEDYAPFDVNVTTNPPAPGAIERTGPTDTTYGTRVLVTGGGAIYDDCRCGGVAYVDVFDLTQGHEYYQPAWVFTQGTSTSGKRLGEAASHEAGHTLGLHHDGAGSAAYYTGAAPWAPIMGSSYNQPVTQWSAGDYAGATNVEDDVAMLAAQLGVRADDHADTSAGATRLAATPREGVIATRDDTDAFSFTASGATTLSATPGPGLPDLDLGLRILDAEGRLVASIDPPVARAGPSAATGLDATWSATLGATPTTYTAVVDGVGAGDPSTAGSYTDYASLGHYRVALTTEAPIGTALTVTASTPAPGTVGIAYADTPAAATGGEAPYTWSATGLPGGLALDPRTGAVVGTPADAGTFRARLTVADANGSTATATVDLVVAAAPVPTQPTAPVATAAVPTVPTTAVPTAGVTAPPAGATRFGFATAARLPSGRVHRPYRARITTLGADGAVTWRRSGALPSGLRLVRRPRGTVVVVGRPADVGRHLVRLVARDAGGRRIERRFVLRIRR